MTDSVHETVYWKALKINHSYKWSTLTPSVNYQLAFTFVFEFLQMTNQSTNKIKGLTPWFSLHCRVKNVQLSNIKVSVKENEVPTEKNSSRASIFATKASYISN